MTQNPRRLHALEKAMAYQVISGALERAMLLYGLEGNVQPCALP